MPIQHNVTYYALQCGRVLLAGKNVAADIADQLCESVATKLEGKVLGTFESE